MPKISINEAYCITLGRVVSVKEMESFAQSSSPLRSPSFYCSTPDCRNKKIQISLVGYEQRIYGEKSDVPIHFRTYPYQEHLESCQWHPLNYEKAMSGETEELNPQATTHNPREPKKKRNHKLF